ncbi:MAG: hypothetical protein H0X30_16785 [Anaerolineae bacterium]|nr:hypothetical protein [Anaerolineae bacterium]
MKRHTIVLCALLLSLLALSNVFAKDKPDYPLDFPVPNLTVAQIKEARNCDFKAVPPTSISKPNACQLAQQALVLAKARKQNTAPTDEELELVNKIATLNPAVLLRLDLIVQYFGSVSLVAPPDFSSQPITKLTLVYKFEGLGSNTYVDITITNADKTPVITGTAHSVGWPESSSATTPVPTSTPVPLAKTVDSKVVQAFGSALTDFLPIRTQFSSTRCYDYYPNWAIELTFADKTTLFLVTKNSNAIGIGGPWQTEIDGKYYMQYSSAIQAAVVDLFKALDLKFGETAAMGCGPMDELLDDAFPSAKTS